jgi:hypothetical protein
MGPFVWMMLATLQPYPAINDAPGPQDPNAVDRFDLAALLHSPSNPIRVSIEGGGTMGPGFSQGYSGSLRASYDLASGLGPDVLVNYDRWAVTSGSGVLVGLRLGAAGGRVRPYLAAHLGAELFPSTVVTSEVGGVGAGLEAEFGIDVMITQHVGLGLHAAVNALVPSFDSWGDLGGGISFKL